MQSKRDYVAIAGRVLLSALFLLSGFSKIVAWSDNAGYMASKGMPLIPLFLSGAIVIEILGGLSLLFGWKPRWGAWALFLFLIPTTIIFHNFWALEGPARVVEMMHFMKNLTIMGGLLTLASASRANVRWTGGERLELDPHAARRVAGLAIGALLVSNVAVAKWPEGTKPFASAELEPRGGSKVTGTVDFGRKKGALLVRVYLKDIAPGAHAFHIHEKGDCSAPDASSAGEHFNPTNAKHGGPKSAQRHVGDFGNLVVPKSGTLTTELQVPTPPGFDWSEIVRKSVIVHKSKDDLVSQPSGKSGDRIACGVILRMDQVAE